MSPISKTFTDEKQKIFILLGFSVLLLIHAIFVFAGFYNNDDINYSRYAAHIVHNGFSFTPAISHYQLRWTVIFISAFFYKLFGINAFSSELCSFVSFILCGILLKKILSNYKTIVYFFSLLFFFLAHSIIFYTHRLLPDPAMCLAVLWMYFSYRSHYLAQNNPLYFALQFSVAFLLAVLTKETIIIALPLFVTLFLYDIFKRKRLPFWGYSILCSSIFIFLYLLYFKITTGSFFYRYNLLEAANNKSGHGFDNAPFAFILNRIGYELWLAMLLNGDLLVFLPAVAAFIYRKKIRRYINIEDIDFYAFLTLLLSANFMTISFTHYVPLPQDPRHFLFLFPFAAIVAGALLYAYSKSPTQFLVLPLSLIIATMIMFSMHAGNTKYLYLLFSLILISRCVLPWLNKSRTEVGIFLMMVTLLFLFNYLIDFIQPPYPYFANQKRIIDNNFSKKNVKGKIFFADELSGEIGEFMLRFQTKDLQFLPIDSLKVTDSGNLYYMINSALNPIRQAKIKSVANLKRDSDLVLIEKAHDVSLYKANNLTLQKLK